MFHMRLIEPVGIAKLRADGYFYNQRILVNRALTNLLSPYPSAGGAGGLHSNFTATYFLCCF